jgi:hypothetical protein
MGLVNNFKRIKKIKTIKSRNVIINDWSYFLKNYPLVSAKLSKDKGEELKPLIHPSTKIKIYFTNDNIIFYLIGVSGNEEKIPNNVIYNSWDEVSMEELNELLR